MTIPIKDLIDISAESLATAIDFEEAKLLSPETVKKHVELSQAASLLAIARLLDHIVDHGIPGVRGA
jgi:hypothetical protein